jgi:hypothetical protein
MFIIAISRTYDMLGGNYRMFKQNDSQLNTRLEKKHHIGQKPHWWTVDHLNSL